MLPSLNDVRNAGARLRGRVVRTPIVSSERLNHIAGVELYLKCENLQRVGAFKARGALNNLLQLKKEQLARGVLTYSSGNHAQAVAWAAKACGTPATVCMPIDAPEVKVAGVRQLGAEIVQVGTTSTERQQRALEIQRISGATMIEPFDHAHTVSGQGTATLELLEDTAAMGVKLDAIVVPVGGGGLIAGACLAAAETDVTIVAVEPLGCDSMRRSLDAGQIVGVDPGHTLADGLKSTKVGEIPFAIARQRVSCAVTVDDEELKRALVTLLVAAKLLVEPSGAAALAAVLRGLPGNPRRIGVLLSGGNVEPTLVGQWLGEHRVH